MARVGLRSCLLLLLIITNLMRAHPESVLPHVTFKGATQACAGGVPDALHTFKLVAQVKDAGNHPLPGQAVVFECPTDSQGPRFVLPDGTLTYRHVAKSLRNGRVPLSIRSGRRVGSFRLVAYTVAAPHAAVLGQWTLRVVGAECRRRFPWHWVGHTDPNEVTSAGEGSDNGWLTTDPGATAAIAHYKFYLKCRRDARRGDLDGNWSVVNGHRVKVWITEARFSDSGGDAPDIVISEPRHIMDFWRLDGAARNTPTQMTLVTHGDGAASVRVRRVRGKPLPSSLKGRQVSYTLGYNDESQNVTLLPPISLSLRDALSPPGTLGRVRLLVPPTNVKGTLAWTITAGVSAKPPDSAAGLYVMRVDDEGGVAPAALTPQRSPQHFKFGVQDPGNERGGEVGLAIAPDSNSVIFNSEPEEVALGMGDSYAVVASLRALDLTTGQSRVLIAAKNSRSGFRWSPDGRYLSFHDTDWRWPYEQEGLGLSYDVTHPIAVLNLQTLKTLTWDAAQFGSALAWTPDNRLLWSEFTLLNKPSNARREYARTMQRAAAGGASRLWRDGARLPQSSADGRQLAFCSLERPALHRFLRTAGAVYAGPFGTVLWAQDSNSAPRPLTRLEATPDIFWSRDGQRMATVTVEEEDSTEYWATAVQRAVQVTVWNWHDGTIEDTFTLQGQLVHKVSGYPVTEYIIPLELAPDERTLFVRYLESDPKTATRQTAGTASQGVFAIDIASKQAHLIAAFTNVGEVAWRTRNYALPSKKRLN